jgi:hypothetical protein
MRLIGYIRNGKGLLNEVDEPFAATATISVLHNEEGLQVLEVNVGETKPRKPYKKREKEIPGGGVTD